MKDWWHKTCWLHPRDCGTEVVQWPGSTTATPTLLGPVLIRASRAILDFCWPSDVLSPLRTPAPATLPKQPWKWNEWQKINEKFNQNCFCNNFYFQLYFQCNWWCWIVDYIYETLWTYAHVNTTELYSTFHALWQGQVCLFIISQLWQSPSSVINGWRLVTWSGKINPAKDLRIEKIMSVGDWSNVTVIRCLGAVVNLNLENVGNFENLQLSWVIRCRCNASLSFFRCICGFILQVLPVGILCLASLKLMSPTLVSES